MPAESSNEGMRKVWFYISILLIILGIAFYWGWGITYGTWNLLDRGGLGAYIITVMLLGFGIIGALLNRPKKS